MKIKQQKQIVRKNILLFILGILLSNCSTNEKILPIENKYKYVIGRRPKNLVDNKITKIKDINRLLDSYIGNWEGTTSQNNKTYKYLFIISKISDVAYGIEEDILIIKYKIEESSDKKVFKEIANTLDIDNSIGVNRLHANLVSGHYLSKDQKQYHLWYQGLNNKCGQRGKIILENTDNPNRLEVILTGSKYGNTISLFGCPDGPADYIMPINTTTFRRVE